MRLSEDTRVEIGCGLVADVKFSFDDIYDLKYLGERIKNFKEILTVRDDDFFPSKPQILVIWTGKNLTSENTSIWMYASELTIVQKVVKVTNRKMEK